jgi:RND family efflux transporter MFP subunit
MPTDELQDAERPLTYSALGVAGAGRRRRWMTPLLLASGAAALGLGIYAGIRDRAEAETELARVTDAAATPVVEVIHPTAGAPSDALVLPGDTRAFSDTAIFARTNGYLKRWYFDIGARVKRGQLLAEIETPEVDDQLRQALADLGTAQANLRLATITAERYENLLKTRSVSVQDRDNAAGALETNKAIVQSRQATVSQLQQMQSFEKVYAPFDGVVTARSTDVGALINAGTATATRELFHMAATDTLRIYVAVPETYSPLIRSGSIAKVTLDEFPGQTFDGTVVRNANSIDLLSRTLLVEVDVDNASGKLLPGAYAFVHFTLPGEARSVTVPANTLLFRKEGLRVGVVHDGKVELTAVKIGHDYGDKVEVIAGLAPGDEIVVNPSDSLANGAAVHVNEQKDVGSAK